ncbi:MAG TPA: cation:proton antiporter [Bryobacteraceae bacterium]|nr:cation:proton antiporter [Bryobacteraceae bacterium]
MQESAHHISLVFIELGASVVGLALLARLARRFGFSAIPLYLLAGLAFGNGGLLPLGLSSGFIHIGAEIGVPLLLLMLGLESNGEELRENLLSGFPAGLADFILNFPPGFVAGMLMGWPVMGAALLGGVTWISSSGIIAKLLSDQRRLNNPETATVHESDEVVLLTTFGLMLLVAGVAQRLQVSSAIGAFLVGVALSGPLAKQSRRLLAPLRDLFAVIFFFFFGLQIDPASLPPVALAAIALGLVTSATKVITGYWAAKRNGIEKRGRWQAGIALVSRGEFSIVIAGLGTAIGPKLGPFAAAYVTFLAVFGPSLARVFR